MLMKATFKNTTQHFSQAISFATFLMTGLLVSVVVSAQDAGNEIPQQGVTSQSKAKNTKEPVFRVSKLNREKQTPAKLASSVKPVEPKLASAEIAKSAILPSALLSAGIESTLDQRPNSIQQNHSLDRAIQMATDGLAQMRANVRDYSAIMVKRERVDGVVGSPAYMRMKVRCPRSTPEGDVPFSVYLKFLKPRKVSGREVIWTDGANGNKLCAHESGLMGMKRFNLDPDGWLAMQGNKYPVYLAGIENLMLKLIERAERDKRAGDCKVDYRSGVELMKRPCSLIEVIHEEKRPPFDYYKAQIFIDDQLNMPVRYVSYDWPTSPGAKPEIIEEYTYLKISLNEGFQDIDFSPDNPAYKYPSR